MKKIAVFTSGGDAPGMNACIRAVVRTANHYDVEVHGIIRGYDGMIKGNYIPMNNRSVSNVIQKGGTILKSARSEEFRTAEGRKIAYESLKENGIEGLIGIGGDGTFTGLKIFSEEYDIPVIGAPGTIDNDLFGTDFTIGYDTAVNTALDAIDKIRDTADAHDRIFFVEVMGRDTGYIAIRSAIGGGAEMAITPENRVPAEGIIKKINSSESGERYSHIIIVAEGHTPGYANHLAQKTKEAMPQHDIRVSMLGHIQRGGSPTASDRVLASRLGVAAVEALLADKSSVMVGVINRKLHFTSLTDAIEKEKPLNVELVRIIEILNGRIF